MSKKIFWKNQEKSEKIGKNETKNIRLLVFSFSPIDLSFWCILFCFVMWIARFQILISEPQSIWRKLLVLSWLYIHTDISSIITNFIYFYFQVRNSRYGLKHSRRAKMLSMYEIIWFSWKSDISRRKIVSFKKCDFLFSVLWIINIWWRKWSFWSCNK